VSALLYQDGEYPPRNDEERAGSAALTGRPGRSARTERKVPVMTDVACFCGRLFSFDGGAAACPRCGEVASVTGLPVTESPGCSWPETLDEEIRQLTEVSGARQRPLSA
jgi:hypothetical protein